MLGLLWGEGLDADPETPVEEVMEYGPSTVRPHVSPEEAAEHAKDMDGVLITTPDGILLGLLHLEEHEHDNHTGGHPSEF